LFSETGQGYQDHKMRIEIEAPAEYVRQAADFRKNIFDRIAARDPGQAWLNASVKDVKKVIVIAAASRSGSSLLFTLLKKIPCIYSLSGEGVPFYKLNGFSSDSFFSDEIPAAMPIRKGLWLGLSRDFLSDFSLAAEEGRIIEEEDMVGSYIDDLALRFSLQWPTAGFSYEVFTRLAKLTYETYIKTHRVFCAEEFYLELIRSLRREYGIINPYYYDIPVGMVREKFPDLEIPSGPPQLVSLIEEPPFILLPIRRKVKKEDLSDKILLLKSSVDCYRLPFLETIFSNADIKVIYLARNPLGSVNGLYDGWLYRGFFSHNLKAILKSQGQALEITGYSDRYEWGKWWWNYDLPDGWQGYTRKRLEEVCAFQWLSANNAVQQYLKKSGKRHCSVKYENMIGSLASRTAEINKIMDFIGLGSGMVDGLGLDKLPVVQATQQPQAYRWKKRKDMLLPILDDPKISVMANELGYRKDNIEEWF
jgi:hypothetical protein